MDWLKFFPEVVTFHAIPMCYCLTINATEVNCPPPPPTGKDFLIVMLFVTHKGTGTGEIDLLINTQDKIPVGNNTYVQPMGPADYQVTWSARAKPDPNCKGHCEQWLPGNYTVSVGMYS